MNSDEEPRLTGGHENQGRCNQKQAEGISYGKTNQSTNKSKQEETCSTGRGNQVWAVVSSRDWNREHSSPNRRVAEKKSATMSRNPHRGGSSRTHIAAPKPETKQEQQNRSRHTKSKREEYTAHTSCKTQNFSLTSTRFTIDPEVSALPPSFD
jgi:hypothetical protein